MPQQPSPQAEQPSRRSFLKTSVATVAGAGLASTLSLAPSVHAGGGDVIRVGLIGCGGRGRGAADQAVHAGDNIRLTALGDAFADHLDEARKILGDSLGDRYAVKDDHCFTGFDAYKKVLATDVDVVLLTTPPHFRPEHLRAAVEAGKHVFAEKPIAVDGPGVRSVLATCAEAKKKNLSIVSGLCWRYDQAMRDTFQRVHDGAIGDIMVMQCTYNTGLLWTKTRQPSWSDMEWQLRNWLYFTWLSGDHIVEQHVHSLDKMAWALNDEYPVKAYGVGGRQSRTGPEYGHIFDHHSVVFEYKNGVKVFSMCRQQENCAKDVSDHLFGTKGTCDIQAAQGQAVIKKAGPTASTWHSLKSKDDMYQSEHNALFESIRTGKPINNGEYMSNSSLMAIMGRMATYTGQVITWEQALNSQEDLTPVKKYEWCDLPIPPVAKPGVTKVV
jgi:predicted dehydrogenase